MEIEKEIGKLIEDVGSYAEKLKSNNKIRYDEIRDLVDTLYEYTGKLTRHYRSYGENVPYYYGDIISTLKSQVINFDGIRVGARFAVYLVNRHENEDKIKRLWEEFLSDCTPVRDELRYYLTNIENYLKMLVMITSY